MSSINMTGLGTLTAEQIRDINELTFDEVIKTPELSEIMTIFNNIVFNKEVGFLTTGGLIGKAGMSCDPTADGWSLGTRKMTWTPKQWSVRLEDCWADLQESAVVYAMNKGVDRADLTNTDYASLVKEGLVEALKKFAIRLIWFNDTAAENQEEDGEIKDGVDVAYFNILDGLFKQINTQVTANAKQKVTISENAGASYSAQALTPAKAVEYLNKVYFSAPVTLRGMRDSFMLVSQSVYDAYLQSLAGTQLESMFANMQDGKANVSFMGVKLIPMPVWDDIIANYYDTGAKLINPHRIVYTAKSVLGLAVDDYNQFDTFNMFYDAKSRKVLTDAGGRADAKLRNPQLFVYAG